MSQIVHIRRGCTAAALSLVLSLALAATSTAAATVRGPAFAPGSRYLALGDSVTFGYEEPQVTPPPNFNDPASLIGFPEHIARTMRDAVTNASCPGETSASFINAQALSNGCENAYRKAFPLHVRYTGSQLSFAVRYLRVHRDTRLVSLMIGANDLFLCEARAAQHCATTTEQQAVATTAAANVRHILAALRRQGGYRGQIVIVNYYSLDYTSTLITGAVQTLNRAVDAAGRRYGAEIADGFGDNPCTAGLITRTGVSANGTPSCGVHPTYAGQALLAEAVLRAARL